jgi:hypothetical protein
MTTTDNNVNDSATDTSNIDAKKAPPPSTATKYLNFFKSVLIILIIVIIYFFNGSLILYGCKVSQSNVLPTDLNCEPYTDNQPKITPIFTNIFIRSGGNPTSMKLSIPYSENKKNTVIDLLRKSKYNPNSGNATNFFISVLEGLLSFNYSWIDTVFTLLNHLPESLILLLGPIVLMFVVSVMLIVEFFYLCYLWFSNISWFFKTNVATGENEKPKWEPVTFIEPFNFYWGCVMAFIFFILFFVLLIGLPFVLPFLPFFTTSWALLSVFGYKGNMNGQTVKFTDIFKDTLKYYKTTFMVTFTLLTALSAFSNLGTTAGTMCLVTVILLTIFSSYYKDVAEQGLSALVSDEQAIRQCTIKKKMGWVENLLNSFGIQLGGVKTVAQEVRAAGKIIENSNKNNTVNVKHTRRQNPIVTPSSPIVPSNPLNIGK